MTADQKKLLNQLATLEATLELSLQEIRHLRKMLEDPKELSPRKQRMEEIKQRAIRDHQNYIAKQIAKHKLKRGE